MKRLLAACMTGVVIGAALMNLYLSRRVDEIYISREKLKVELYVSTERLKKLEAQNRRQQLLIRQTEVVFIKENGDLLVELPLKAKILALTKDLIGEEVEKVHHSLVMHLLDQRLFDLEGKRYRLHVKSIIIAPKMTFVLNYSHELQTGEDEL